MARNEVVFLEEVARLLPACVDFHHHVGVVGHRLAPFFRAIRAGDAQPLVFQVDSHDVVFRQPRLVDFELALYQKLLVKDKMPFFML